MSIRVHGGMTVAHAKREDLADEIASVTGQTVRAVSRTLDATHGKTHLRAAFDDVWPARSVEFSKLTAAAATAMGLEEDIAAILDLTPRQVRGRLNRVGHGKTLVGTIFAADWPVAEESSIEEEEVSEGEDAAEDEAQAPDLGSMNVARARRLDLSGAIADRTGLGLRRVRALLRGAHGNVQLANLFGDDWGDGNDTAIETHVDRTVLVGAGGGRTQPPMGLVGDRYRLIRSLGKGGQGEAFEASDQELPERGLVVIKFASFDTAAREFTIAQRFKHENICQYFDTAFDKPRNHRYLVIEHGGRSLSEVVAERGAFAADEVFGIVAQAALALDYAHTKSVIHHDVSPGNILMDDEGVVRVTDFGISVAGMTVSFREDSALPDPNRHSGREAA